MSEGETKRPIDMKKSILWILMLVVAVLSTPIIATAGPTIAYVDNSRTAPVAASQAQSTTMQVAFPRDTLIKKKGDVETLVLSRDNKDGTQVQIEGLSRCQASLDATTEEKDGQDEVHSQSAFQDTNPMHSTGDPGVIIAEAREARQDLCRLQVDASSNINTVFAKEAEFEAVTSALKGSFEIEDDAVTTMQDYTPTKMREEDRIIFA